MRDESVLGGEELQEQIAETRALWEAGFWRDARTRLLRLRSARGDEPPLLAALGDCHAAGGRWQEAVHWYEESLAGQYDPEVARRLEVARASLAALGAPPRRVPVYAIVGLAALVLIVAGVVVYLARPGRSTDVRPETRAGRPTPVAPPAGPATPRGPELATRTVEPLPVGPATGGRRAPGATPSPARRTPSPRAPTMPPALPPVKITKTVEAPTTDEDHFLTQLLGTLNWPDGTPLSGDALVQFDPYTGYAFVTLNIPRALSSGDLVKVTLDAAYGASVTLMKGSPSVRFVTIRALYTSARAGEKARTVVAFRGNTSREAMEYWERLDRRPDAQEMWYQAFASCWWNPEVPVKSAAQPSRRE